MMAKIVFGKKEMAKIELCIQTGSISAKIKCLSGSGVKPFTVRYSGAVPSICGSVITIGPPK